MQKKLLTACAVLAALAAFSVTPAASASPVLTENGSAVAVGSSVTAKNTGNILFTFTGGSTVACESADLKGNVYRNSGFELITEIPVGNSSITGTGTGGDCTSSLGPFRANITSTLCLRTTVSEMMDTVLASGCGTEVHFTLEFTSLGTCKYHTASFLGSFSTSADATVNFSEQPYLKEAGGLFCPGNGLLDMDLDLTTTDGTTLLIS